MRVGWRERDDQRFRCLLMLSVTGTVTEVPPVALTVILPVYVPTAKLPIDTLTGTTALPVPEA